MPTAKHYQNINPRNLDRDKAQFKDKEQKLTIDVFFVLFLLGIGFTGLILAYDRGEPDFRNATQAHLYPEDNAHPHYLQDKDSPIAPNSRFLMSGHKEAKQNIQFTLQPFDKYATYVVHFGDDSHKQMTSNTVSHQYNSVGEYYLKVIRKKRGQSKVIIEKKMNIGHAPNDAGDWEEMPY